MEQITEEDYRKILQELAESASEATGAEYTPDDIGDAIDEVLAKAGGAVDAAMADVDAASAQLGDAWRKDDEAKNEKLRRAVAYRAAHAEEEGR